MSVSSAFVVSKDEQDERHDDEADHRSERDREASVSAPMTIAQEMWKGAPLSVTPAAGFANRVVEAEHEHGVASPEAANRPNLQATRVYPSAAAQTADTSTGG